MTADLAFDSIITLLPLVVASGLTAGFLAGLLGIGGGIVLVPCLYYTLVHAGFPGEGLMHVAVGTSLAIIIPTGSLSAFSHWKKGGVNLPLAKTMIPGILLGVLSGTLIADGLSSDSLKLVFACALCLLSGIILFQPEGFHIRPTFPGQPVSTGIGWLSGLLSTLMGIGGATINVPLMTLFNVPIRQAIGTSSALGVLIGIPGCIGFITIGWGNPGTLPPFSVGYVNLALAALIVPFSMLAVPWGVKLAHSLNTKRLKKIFGIFVLIVAAKMIAEALYG